MNMLKKMDVIMGFSVVLMAISISFIDFDNLSWSKNLNSYFGLLISIILFLSKALTNKNKKADGLNLNKD